MDWILVTGQPGSGKTTAVKRMIDLLQQNGVFCKGFFTEEVLDKAGSRVGFDIITVPDGERAVLSRKEGIRSKYKTGQYHVDVQSFEALALPSLSAPDSTINGGGVVYVLDEIGRMELHSTLFQEQVRRMANDNLRLVGAVTAPRYGHVVPFCDEIASLDNVKVHNLTKKTRNDVVDKILKSIGSRWLGKSP
jgi:nucleoside-triphosphatase